MVSKMHCFKAKVYCLRNAESSFHKTIHTMTPFITILDELCLSHTSVKIHEQHCLLNTASLQPIQQISTWIHLRFISAVEFPLIHKVT